MLPFQRETSVDGDLQFQLRHFYSIEEKTASISLFCCPYFPTTHEEDYHSLRPIRFTYKSSSWPRPAMFATCWICPLKDSPGHTRSRRWLKSDRVGDVRLQVWRSQLTFSQEGITRELYALLGERAPPIAINENKYKGRPKWMNKLRVRPWYVPVWISGALGWILTFGCCLGAWRLLQTALGLTASC